MNRLKFLLFAAAALGLWGYHLVVSPAASLALVDQGTSALAGAAPAVAEQLEARRSELQAAVLRVAGAPVAWNVGPRVAGKAEAPTADRFQAVRQVVLDGLAEGNRAAVLIAVLTEGGALLSVGAADPAAAPGDLDLAQVAQSGAAGATATVQGVPHLFFSTPLLVSDKNEVRTAGAVLVGLPLWPEQKQLDGVARDLRLSSLALVANEKVVVSGGPDRSQAALVLKALRAGQVGAVVVGSVRTLGPVELPLFVQSPAQAVGARQAIAGTPFEVASVISTREPLEALASFQLFGLAALGGLLLLAVAVALLIKPEDEGGGLAMPPPMPVPPSARKDRAPELPLAVAAHHPAGPEASPDDFQFPNPPLSSSPSSFSISGPSLGAPGGPSFPGGPSLGLQALAPAPAPATEPEADPFASAAPVAPSTAGRPAPVPLSAPPRPGAAPTFKAPPSAAPPPAPSAGTPLPAEPPRAALADDADATRASAVPQELLRASRVGERPAAKSGLLPTSRGSGVGGAESEDKHFQDVFREFVATREKCGEPADGLTFEKFKAKLLKNKEQLVARYQCRTVRFQVYVKEGKAALKATPVKD